MQLAENQSRRATSELLRARIQDHNYLQGAARRSRSVTGVSVSHGRTQTRVMEQLRVARSPETLVQVWRETLAPATALMYAHTLLAQEPTLRPRLRRQVTELRVHAGRHPSRRASALTPSQARLAINLAPTARIKATIVLLWASASRHGDLRGMDMLEVEPLTWRLSWRVQKSDRFGLRRIYKFLNLPEEVSQILRRRKPFASYRDINLTLKKVKPYLTAHSIRRGAATLLANLGYTFSDISALTGHTPTADPQLGVRRYVDPTYQQPESRKQMRMASALLRSLRFP